MAEPQMARSRARDERRSGSLIPDGPSRASYETGESSASGSLRNETPTTSRTLELPDDGFALGSSPSDMIRQRGNGHDRKENHKRRQRHQSGGGFLLQNPQSAERDQNHRRHSRNVPLPKTRIPQPRTPENPQQSKNRSSGTKSSMDSRSRSSTMSPLPPPPTGSSDRSGDMGDDDMDSSPPQHDRLDVPDIDSTQIVNMALNLSESRRIASRRNVSRSNPPRLAPVPDVSTGGSLRQHLQQQRKTSRNLSPKPGQIPSPRLSSSVGVNNSLQPPFENAHHEGSFRYQFSQSTLARAQKAREHLELMAHYRQLLDHLPPLNPGLERSLTTSPPLSPTDRRPGTFRLAQTNSSAVGGRPYNPLQYIRNRKIRARERKVIDGERQGFSDCENVRAWVEQISQRASTSSTEQLDCDNIMPPFHGADDLASQTSPDNQAKNARSRRPRVDWFVEPCDMIADAYWLEQGNHKHLIENRHWRKVYPASYPEIMKPSPKKADDAGKTQTITREREVKEEFPEHKDFGFSTVETGLSTGSTKDRAKAKLQDFAERHNIHDSLSNNHEFLRLRRDSISDLSESDVEARLETKRRSRHGRSGTITSDTNDLLEKQMLELLAKEAKEKGLEDVLETEAEHQRPAEPERGPSTPERRESVSRSPRDGNSRKGSVVDVTDSERRPAVKHLRRGSTPVYRPGRQSLEVPEDHHRRSYEADSSLPTSPELNPFPISSRVPNLSADMSPPYSRPGSPTRNPISRVRQRLRDKNKDEFADMVTTKLEGDVSVPEPSSPIDNTNSLQKRPTTLSRRPSIRTNTTQTSQTQRNQGSLRARTEDQNVGIRGIFKGPRIDTVIRGGVSKLGDMFWRREDSSEFPVDVDTAEDTENDFAHESSTSLSRRESRLEDVNRSESKHFLDAMPTFHTVGENRSKTNVRDTQVSNRPPMSRTQSTQSSRFALLRPPTLDIRSASPSQSPISERAAKPGESDVSDTESYRSSVPDSVRAADSRLNSVIKNGINMSSDKRLSSQQFSIPDRKVSSDGMTLTKREVARMRTRILASGIKAREIGRRANENCRPLPSDSSTNTALVPRNTGGIPWQEIVKVVPDPSTLRGKEMPYCEVYPFAARELGLAISASGQKWQSLADHFTKQTSLDMQARIGHVRTRIADDLSNMTRQAADQADESGKDLALDQPLRAKHVVDTIEKMLRNRRRRFRWIRRALWLIVEWVLVGFMWYVWFVVMILRVFLGVGKGAAAGVKWLLWLK